MNDWPPHMESEMTGQCLCGAVQITVAGRHLAGAGACHCRMCRRWTGAVFMSFEAAAEAVSVKGDVRSFSSSGFAERAFCPTCGSHLWMRNKGGDYDLMPGLFESARDLPLISEVYADCAPAWAPFAGSHRTATRAEYEARSPFVEGDTT